MQAVTLTRQFSLYADYNRLMNRRIMAAAGRLDPIEIAADRGAFFKSVLGTLNHILVGDIIWLQRFLAHPPSAAALAYIDSLERPAALDTILHREFDALRRARERVDEVIIDWIAALSEADLDDRLAYRNMAGRAQNKPVASLISHLFLHQVHHRGQATTLLSQAGVDFGDTDLLEIIADGTG